MAVFLEGYNSFKEVVIGAITQITPDSKHFKFLLPSEDMRLGTSIGECIIMRAFVHSTNYPEGKMIRRKFSPTSRHDDCGFFEIPIKIYYPTDIYPGGALTTHLDTLKVGDKIEIAGPRGKYLYQGNGVCRFVHDNSTKQFQKFGFIAGGSGITPCYEYIQYIIEKNENIEISLIYANKKEHDIWFRDKLDEYAKLNKLHVYYILSNPDENWSNGGTGYVNGDIIMDHLPPPHDSNIIFFCGPKPMNRMLRELLPKLGYQHFIKY